MEDKGRLIVGRVNGKDDAFIILLVSIQKGHILESSRELTEGELRIALDEKYDESENEIEARIKRAKTHPGI